MESPEMQWLGAGFGFGIFQELKNHMDCFPFWHLGKGMDKWRSGDVALFSGVNKGWVELPCVAWRMNLLVGGKKERMCGTMRYTFMQLLSQGDGAGLYSEMPDCCMKAYC